MHKPTITALITIRENAGYYLPAANFALFGGKPMFEVMIEKLLRVEYIGRIVVTTDSERVRTTLAGESKVILIGYPEHFSEDPNIEMVETMPASDKMTAHALQQEVYGEHFMQLQPNNPLLTVKSLTEAIERYYDYVLNEETQQWDTLMSFDRVEKRLYSNEHYPVTKLRDDPHYVIFEDNILHIFSRAAFKRNKNKKFGKNPMFYEVPEIEKLVVESDAGYQLAKLAFDNKGLFKQILER
jgi:CMP-N-acetylneuraminic acid synthetase